MRLIDADIVEECMRSNMDMQELYLPIHFIDLVIRQIPTIEAEPVIHGRWIPSLKNIEQEEAAKMLGFDLDEFIQKSAYCSVCGIQQITNGRDKTGKARIHKAVFRFCPNCGAKMDGEQE